MGNKMSRIESSQKSIFVTIVFMPAQVAGAIICSLRLIGISFTDAIISAANSEKWLTGVFFTNPSLFARRFLGEVNMRVRTILISFFISSHCIAVETSRVPHGAVVTSCSQQISFCKYGADLVRRLVMCLVSFFLAKNSMLRVVMSPFSGGLLWCG
jgi:hypothetical protein